MGKGFGSKKNLWPIFASVAAAAAAAANKLKITKLQISRYWPDTWAAKTMGRKRRALNVECQIASSLFFHVCLQQPS